MIDLFGVLSLGELAVEKRNVIIRFIFQYFYALPASCLILARLSHGIQLSNLNIKEDEHKRCNFTFLKKTFYLPDKELKVPKLFFASFIPNSYETKIYGTEKKYVEVEKWVVKKKLTILLKSSEYLEDI